MSLLKKGTFVILYAFLLIVYPIEEVKIQGVMFMKKLIIALLISIITLFALIASPSTAGQYQTDDMKLKADEIVACTARAMGGAPAIESIKTLRIQSVYPDHGEKPIPLEIMRPDKSYSPNSRIAFDGRQACWLNGMDQKSQPKLVDEAELVDFDIEIGLFFPAFFDYPSEYAGTETLGEREVHVLRVKLPHGAVLSYYIDTDTCLPLKADTRIFIQGTYFDIERVYSDYRPVDGILYPHGFTYAGRDRKPQNGRVVAVEFNIPLKSAHVTMPDSIKK